VIYLAGYLLGLSLALNALGWIPSWLSTLGAISAGIAAVLALRARRNR
jgi:hypothetical protein